MQELEKKLNYTFRNSALLQEALNHSSYANENRARGYTSNERLEFLGDSVLGMVTATRLYQLYPDMPEGKMSRLRAELVCEQALHGVALTLHLGDYIRLGHGEERSGGRERPSILADAVEAIIAAMYLDGGSSLHSVLSSRTSSTAWPRGRSTMSRTTRPSCRSACSAAPGRRFPIPSAPRAVRTTTRRSPWPCCSTEAKSAAAPAARKRRRSSPPPGARSNR